MEVILCLARTLPVQKIPFSSVVFVFSCIVVSPSNRMEVREVITHGK